MDSPRRSRRIAGLSPQVNEAPTKEVYPKRVAPQKPNVCVNALLFVSSFLGSVVFARTLTLACNY